MSKMNSHVLSGRGTLALMGALCFPIFSTVGCRGSLSPEDSGPVVQAADRAGDPRGHLDRGVDQPVGPPAVLVRDGVAVSTIVIPQEASVGVKGAAEELASYLEQISGAAVPITDQRPTSGTIIDLGPTKLSLAAQPAALAGQIEGVFVRVREGQVILLGGSDRATRYAVYALLEEGIGCRFLADDVEHLPSRETVEITPLELARQPAFDWRLFHGRAGASLAWGMKLGLNGLYTDEASATVGGAYYLPDSVPSCHAYAKFVPSETHFSSHPEWFPLVDGERQAGGQLCVSAEGLAAEVARQMVDLFDADPQLKMVSISPNDGRYGWCECQACQALDQSLSGGRQTIELEPGKTWPFVGDKVFWFANQVAEIVHQTHPDRSLLELAYINYMEPPDTIQVAANVVPWLAHFAPADYSRAIADPASPENKMFNAQLIRWASLKPDLLFYSYVSKSMWWRLPRPVLRTFAADIKQLHELGVHRYYSQSSLRDWELDGPLYYVIARLLWDPLQDPEVIAADWIEHMFGPAASQMVSYYDAVERAVRGSGQSYTCYPTSQVPGLYVRAELDAARQHLESALATAADEPYRQRVVKVQQVFLYGYHLSRALELDHEASCGVQGSAELLNQGELALAQLDPPPKEATAYVLSLLVNRALGTCAANSWGETETKGGRQCWNSDNSGSATDGSGGWADLLYHVADPALPARLELEVWGTSTLSTISVNTSGDGKATSKGGIWTKVSPDSGPSGQERWETLVFQIPAAAFAPGSNSQLMGLGGGDSQIWVAAGKLTQGP